MRYVLNKDVILRDDSYSILDESTVFLTKNMKKLKVSVSGFKIFKYLEKPKSIDEVANFIMSINSDKTTEDALRDSEKLIESGINLGILEEFHDKDGIIKEYRVINNEYGKEKVKSFRIIPPRFPLSVILSITDKCNINCKHCMAIDVTKKKEKENLDTNKILSVLDELDNNGIHYLKLTGRETTLHPDFIKILKHAADKRFILIVLTNAVDLDEEKINVFGKMATKKDKAFHVSVSLDGATKEEHEMIRGENTFEKTVSNIDKMLEQNVNVYVNTVIHKYNYNNIEEIIKHCGNKGISSITFTMLLEIGNATMNNNINLSKIETEETIKNLLKLKENYKDKIKVNIDAKHFKTDLLESKEENVSEKWPINCCPAGITDLVVNCDGDVYPCIEALGNKDFVIDNVKDKSLVDIWTSNEWNIYRGGWNLNSIENCRECKDNNNCALIRCRIYPYLTHNNFYGCGCIE